MPKLCVQSVLFLATVAFVFATLAQDKAAALEDDSKLVLVVMDPLSAPLACDCVEGYAQRKYEKLRTFKFIHLK